MLQILIIILITNLVFLCFYIKKSNQVDNISYTELQRLQEYRKRSDENFLKPSFEKWVNIKFRKLWFMYGQTSREETFNEFCWGIFNEEIIIEIEQ